MPLSQGAQEEPRAASKLPGRLQGGMPTPQEAFSGAASVTAHPGGRPPLPQAPGSWWRQAVPWTSAPCNSLKRTVCPWTAQILPPGHQGKRGCQRTPQQRSPARRTKSPGPGGGSGWPAGHHRMPGWKGRLDTAQAGGQRPGSKASAEAAVGGTLPVTSACSSLLLAWGSQRPGAPQDQGGPSQQQTRSGIVYAGASQHGPCPHTIPEGPQGWIAGPGGARHEPLSHLWSRFLL